jgi:hypothetical protein
LLSSRLCSCRTASGSRESLLGRLCPSMHSGPWARVHRKGR